MAVGASELIEIAIGAFAVAGALLAAQWLYYWPKVQSVVEKAVSEAMKREHDYVQREIGRLDSRHTGCLFDRKKEIEIVDSKLTQDIAYIRSRIDWLIEVLVNKRDIPPHAP